MPHSRRSRVELREQHDRVRRQRCLAARHGRPHADVRIFPRVECRNAELLDRLSARDQQVIELRIFEDLLSAEVAERLGLTVANVDKIVSRFRRALRKRSATTWILEPMVDVQRLLSDFIAADRSGGDPEPLGYLERVKGTDRAELEALIDAYLARAPRRAFDEAAFAASPSRTLRDELMHSLTGLAGAWPTLLPQLRHRAELKRTEVVERWEIEQRLTKWSP